MMNKRYFGVPRDTVLGGAALAGAVVLLFGLAIDSTILTFAGHLAVGVSFLVMALAKKLEKTDGSSDDRRRLILATGFAALGIFVLGVLVAMLIAG